MGLGRHGGGNGGSPWGLALACGKQGVAGGTDADPDDLHVFLSAIVCIDDLEIEACWAVLDTALLVQGEAFLHTTQAWLEVRVL